MEGGRDAIGWYHEKKSTDDRNIGLGPNRDWSSHGADSFGLMCIHYDQPEGTPARPERYRGRAAPALEALGKEYKGRRLFIKQIGRVELALGRSVGADEVRSAFSFSGSDRNPRHGDRGCGFRKLGRCPGAKRIELLLHAHAGKLWADEEWQMDVTDDKGLILFVINIAAMKSSATLLT